MMKGSGCCGNGDSKGGMPPMMQAMMGKMGENFNPMEMCQRMMETVTATASMTGFATPEVRALFDDWVGQVESEVFALVKQKGQVVATDIAQELKISEDSALYFVAKLIRDKKLKITGMETV